MTRRSVIFFQFFSWGLITAPMIKILDVSFGGNAMLLNGIIMGVKGFLSFLSAPLIGALSDVYGRKMFLLLTAFFTCVPIPFIKVSSTECQQPSLSCSQVNNIAYFVLMAISGAFCVIFRYNFIFLCLFSIGPSYMLYAIC